MRKITSKRFNLLYFVLISVSFLAANPANAQTLSSSNLPIVIINTDNGATIPDDPRILATMKIIYNSVGVTNNVSDQNTTASLNYNGRISIEIRGSTSQDLPKKPYGLTTLLADNVSNNNVSLLGMPSENDWILNSLAFDPSLMRDYLSYSIARNLGNYAARTNYCEVVLNGEYVGLYLLQEKIKADSERVNVTKIATTDITAPKITGGYITKADKTTGNDPIAWTTPTYTGDNVNFIHDLPKPEDVNTQQDTYIHGIFDALSTTSHNNNISFENGYPSVIDVPSFVDFMLSNELASNVDGYQLSTYFHKDRNGKLRAGPIWDFNLTYGNDLFDYGFDRSHNDVWQFSNGDNEGPKFWRDLFNNPSFKCYLSRRWNQVTQAGQPMNLTTINTLIDNTVTYISAAAVRENQKWGTIPDFAGDVQSIKTWLTGRITWMTDNIGTFSACSNVTVPSLVITKINYNPSTVAPFTNSNDQEFIEIKNTGTTTVNLTGIYFSGTGFVYQFPANQTLAANTSVFLASKASVFLSKNGFAAYGEFTRNLSNSNQDLVLADGFGNVIDNVHYYDSAPWPNADGNGSYLTLTSTLLDNNLASSWMASNVALGMDDFDYTAGNFVQLAPNPSTDLISVKTPNPMTKLVIADLEGRIVKTIHTNSNQVDIDLHGFSSGIYILKVTSGNRIETRKFLVQ